MKTSLVATGVAVLAMSAAAGERSSRTEYFVVLDTKTTKCTVVDKKPKTKTTKIVGDGQNPG